MHLFTIAELIRLLVKYGYLKLENEKQTKFWEATYQSLPDLRRAHSMLVEGEYWDEIYAQA